MSLLTVRKLSTVEWKQWEGHVVDGRFHLRQYLGGSAHSGVFLTECAEVTALKVVIKLVPADSDKAQAWMLRRELAARLSHPGLLSILHFGAWQLDGVGVVYAVMEQSDEDLSQVIPVRPLTTAEARDVLVPLLDTLTYIHGEGFVHGCLTPSNIMAVGDRVKLSSDGLLRIGESSDDLWKRNPNGPPEGRVGLTPAGDVWSLGMALVEILTQRAPVWHPDGTNDPLVPECLEAPFLDIARRSLRADPRLRCSLRDIGLVLQPPASAPQPRPAEASAIPAAKRGAPAPAWRRQYLLPAVAGAVLGVVAFAAILTHSNSSSPSAGTGPVRPAAVEQAAMQAQPAPVPATAPAQEAAPPNVEKAREAPAPETRAATMPTAAPVAAQPGAGNAGGKRSAGDAVGRFVPEVPPQILGTIRGIVRVDVRVKVDRLGSVVDEELDSPAGSKYFDRVALDAARRWKFNAASDSGNPAESTRVVRFEFRTNGCRASSN
jgi:TonB family protein